VTIRNRIFPHILRVIKGNVRVGQLSNYVRNRLVKKAEIISGLPTHISFFVTSKCNFRCDMCPTHSKKIPNNYLHRHHVAPDMSLDLFRFVLDRYPNIIRVPLIGVGEPLLNPYLFDLIKESIKRRMITNIVTNGYILDSYITDIIHSGIHKLSVSVNGHTAAEFNRMTGNPEKAYLRILENVEAFVRARYDKKAKLYIELSFIIDKYNYNNIKEMIQIGENLGIDGIYLANFQASPYPGFTPEERCLYTGNPAVLEELTSLMSKKYSCHVRWPYLLSENEDKRSVCRWPFSILIVDGAGNVGGCPMQILNMHENGKVFDEDPWNNKYFRELRRRHLHGDLFWPCKSCVECTGVPPRKVIKSKIHIRVGKR